ncbi:hypothetical protein ABIF38_004667 [Bradyrhizobium japonicum]|uniref:DUF4926 domain-containing protein n=2 Tax=Nitrobacteraceae TaxID=41294 RepID=A0ABV4F836_BRAEL|nr:hypothetical protein [Bradyrhizobium elkanii]MCS3693588.1 hypothetical protein [Bradyrhizobium elkanii]MCW2192492.1 hypothetical protein [Bradyrhizobium elkanii]GEC53929.1 hypothetical protein BEL01nite_29720 [Bradyrhizobium elkanii]
MIDVMAIKVGTRLKLAAGVVAEVEENMDDGQWLQVRYLECPARPADVGTVELCHAQDVIKVLCE